MGWNVIVAGILVARHLKTTEDLFDNRASPRTESMIAAASSGQSGWLTPVSTSTPETRFFLCTVGRISRWR